jgi:hypothetical protein
MVLFETHFYLRRLLWGYSVVLVWQEEAAMEVEGLGNLLGAMWIGSKGRGKGGSSWEYLLGYFGNEGRGNRE